MRYCILVMLCIAVEIRETERERDGDYFDRVINHPADGPGHTLTAFHSSDTYTHTPR